MFIREYRFLRTINFKIKTTRRNVDDLERIKVNK